MAAVFWRITFDFFLNILLVNIKQIVFGLLFLILLFFVLKVLKMGFLDLLSVIFELLDPGFEDSVFSLPPPKPYGFDQISDRVFKNNAKVKKNIQAHSSDHRPANITSHCLICNQVCKADHVVQ